jgi:hypothetical protein
MFRPASRISLRRPAKNIPLNIKNRKYAIQAPGAPTLEVFNRQSKWLQKERSASDREASRNVDYLRDEAAFRLSERLLVSLTSTNVCVLANLCRTSIAGSTMYWI